MNESLAKDELTTASIEATAIVEKNNTTVGNVVMNTNTGIIEEHDPSIVEERKGIYNQEEEEVVLVLEEEEETYEYVNNKTEVTVQVLDDPLRTTSEDVEGSQILLTSSSPEIKLNCTNCMNTTTTFNTTTPSTATSTLNTTITIMTLQPSNSSLNHSSYNDTIERSSPFTINKNGHNHNAKHNGEVTGFD